MLSSKICLIVAVASLSGCVAGCGERSLQVPAPFQAQEPVEPIDRVVQNANSQMRTGGTLASSNPAANAVRQVADAQPAVDASGELSKVPLVQLTKHHAALCRVKVGDPLPEIALPKLGGDKAILADLYGKAATVIVFWRNDRRMCVDELADLGPDVEKTFGPKGVAVIGIAEELPEADVKAALEKAESEFLNLLDADGKAFAKVGTQKLPWTLLVDAKGRIVWFDI